VLDRLVVFSEHRGSVKVTGKAPSRVEFLAKSVGMS
jgi:hypothetical protein